MFLATLVHHPLSVTFDGADCRLSLITLFQPEKLRRILYDLYVFVLNDCTCIMMYVMMAEARATRLIGIVEHQKACIDEKK